MEPRTRTLRLLSAVLFVAFIAGSPSVSGAPSVTGATGATPAAPRTSDEEAVAAYRAGDYETAHSLWTRELDDLAEAPGTGPERARIAYNLGNVAFRMGDVAEAVGWYTASLALAPRDADAWANLELARTEAGLEPADRGDLASTFERVATSMTLAESEWLLLATIALFGACLAGEALRGSAAWRRAAFAALFLCFLAAIPWGWSLLRAGGHPMLVVADATAARSEPRPDAKRLEELTLGAEVQKLDELPGWVQVRDPDGDRVWVRDNAVFDLVR